jgi:transporter family protein
MLGMKPIKNEGLNKKLLEGVFYLIAHTFAPLVMPSYLPLFGHDSSSMQQVPLPVCHFEVFAHVLSLDHLLQKNFSKASLFAVFDFLEYAIIQHRRVAFVLFAYVALAGRIVMLGFERIVVKKLGTGANPKAALMLFVGLAALFLLPFAVNTVYGGHIDWAFIKYVAASSLIYALAFLLYIRALSEGEASLVAPLSNFNILFLLVLSILFLSESFSFVKGAGLLVLLYGATFLNRQRNMYLSLKALLADKPCQMMMASSFLVAIGRIIDKGGAASTSPVLYSFFLYFFVALYLGLLMFLRKNLKEVFVLFKDRPWISLASGFINAYAYLCLLISFKSIEVSIAEPLSMLSMVVTVMLSSIILKEDIRYRLKGVFFMFIGASLLCMA